MSMLAERKRKEKWCLNPRGKDWVEDSNKFGQRLLEKMGWSKGKGLGANENGIREHIRVTQKNDNKGMGYKENSEQWTENEDQFSNLLKNLSSQASNGNVANAECNTETNTDSVEIQSLEKKSQNSRVRVHYHKFTRGKDLSRYSEKDIANIFGKKSIDEINSSNCKSQEDSVNEEKDIGTEQSSFGVTVIKGGTMQDYFNKRLNGLKKFSKSNTNDIQQNSNDFNMDTKVDSSTFYLSLNDTENNILDAENKEKKSKRKKRKHESDIESTAKHLKLDENGIENELDVIDSKKSKKKKQLIDVSSESYVQSNSINNSDQKIRKVKKQKNCSSNTNSDSDINNINIDNEKNKNSLEGFENAALQLSAENDHLEIEVDAKKKKKSKSKIKNLKIDSFQGIINHALDLSAEDRSLYYENTITETEKKKKSKEQKFKISNGIENPALELSKEEISITEETKENIKKKKKKKSELDLGIRNEALQLSDNDTEINQDADSGRKKSKKNKNILEITSTENSLLDDTYNGMQLSDNTTEINQDTDSRRKKSKKNKNILENTSNEKSLLDDTYNGMQSTDNTTKINQDTDSRRKKSKKNKNILENTSNENSLLDDTYNDIKKSKKHKKSKHFGIENPGLDISSGNSDINNSEVLADSNFIQMDLEVTRDTKKSKKIKKSFNAGIENPALDISSDNSNSAKYELVNSFEVERKKSKNIKNSINLGIENPTLDLTENNIDDTHLELKSKKRKHKSNETGIINPALDLSIDDADLQTPVKKSKKMKHGIENPSLNLESEIPNNNIPTPKSALKKKKVSIDNSDSSIKLRVHKRRKSVIINESLNEEKYITDHETTFESSNDHINPSDSLLSLNNSIENEPGNLSHIIEKIDSYQNELENSINEHKEEKNEEKKQNRNNFNKSPTKRSMDNRMRKQMILNKLKNNDVSVNFPGANIFNIKGYGCS